MAEPDQPSHKKCRPGFCLKQNPEVIVKLPRSKREVLVNRNTWTKVVAELEKELGLTNANALPYYDAMQMLGVCSDTLITVLSHLLMRTVKICQGGMNISNPLDLAKFPAVYIAACVAIADEEEKLKEWRKTADA